MENVKSEQTIPQGRQQGSLNFKYVEDVSLARAYAKVSTDPTVGTDQNCKTFWAKIQFAFKTEMGDTPRSANSLQNRWNNTVEKAILKFVALLTKALGTFHIGWSMEEYISDAKKLYLDELGKEFSFELCWMEVKSLPKFKVDLSSVGSQVQAALQMDTNHTEEAPTIEKSSSASMDTSASKNTLSDSKGTSAKNMPMAPLLSSGKKRNHLKLQLRPTDKFKDQKQAAREQLLSRLVEASETRHKILDDNMAFQLFNSMQGTEHANKFLALKAEEYLVNMELEIAKKKRKLAILNNELKQCGEKNSCSNQNSVEGDLDRT